MTPDRGHIHHRLIDMGFSQKQAVAVLYIISAILGLSAVVHDHQWGIQSHVVLVALCAAGGLAAGLFLTHNDGRHTPQDPGRHHKTQISGNDNFFGEEDQSEK